MPPGIAIALACPIASATSASVPLDRPALRRGGCLELAVELVDGVEVPLVDAWTTRTPSASANAARSVRTCAAARYTCYRAPLCRSE